MKVQTSNMKFDILWYIAKWTCTHWQQSGFNKMEKLKSRLFFLLESCSYVRVISYHIICQFARLIVTFNVTVAYVFEIGVKLSWTVVLVSKVTIAIRKPDLKVIILNTSTTLVGNFFLFVVDTNYSTKSFTQLNILCSQIKNNNIMPMKTYCA